MRKIRKAIGALLGGVTGATVTMVLSAFDVEVAPELAAALAVVLATIGTWLAPPNEAAPE